MLQPSLKLHVRSPELSRTLRDGPQSVFLKSGLQSDFLHAMLFHHAIGKTVDQLTRPRKGSKGQSLQIHSGLRASSSSTIPHLLRCC